MKLIMEQSFENENTCEVFLNEVRIKNELLQKPEEIFNRRM
jgi:hypothetical protein